MRKLIIAVLVLISLDSFAQPTNYTWYKQRIRQYSLMLDSMLYIPRYNGTPSGVRANETSSIDGAIAVDTANGRQYFYYNGSWRRLANYSELGVDSIWREAGKDSIFYSKGGSTYKIKDSTGGGGATPTLQQVLTAGSTLTSANDIILNSTVLRILNGGEEYLKLNPTLDNEEVELRVFNPTATNDARVVFSTTDLHSYGEFEADFGDGINVSRVDVQSSSGSSKVILSAFNDGGGLNGSYLHVGLDSIMFEPEKGIINIDSLRTWSAVADTTYKKPMTWDTRNGRWEYASNWFGGGVGSSAISSLTAAAATNDINNADYGQTWRWNTLSSGVGLQLSTTSTASTDAGHTLFGIDMQGANANSNQTTYAASFVNSHTGTTSTNIGLLLQAYGGTNNYPLDLGVEGSNLGRMRLNGSTSGSIVIQPAAAAGTYTLTLPTTDGASGEFLQTDGSGVLTWAAASGGTPAGSNKQVQYNSSGSFAGAGNMTREMGASEYLQLEEQSFSYGNDPLLKIRASHGVIGLKLEGFVNHTPEIQLTDATGGYDYRIGGLNDGSFRIYETSSYSSRINLGVYGNGTKRFSVQARADAPSGNSVEIFSVTAGSTGLVITGASGQTANLLEIKNSTPSNLAVITATGSFDLYNGTAPTSSVTNGIRLYSEDVTASAELKVRDEAGNITTLSPHNFGKIPGGRSEKLAWSFYSQRNGEYITADMTKALRTIENQSSEIEELKRQVAELKGLIYEMKAPVKLIHTGKVK